jgi:hypothetical protein
MTRLAAIISLIVMLAGCGGGSSSADPAASPAAPPTPAPASGAAPTLSVSGRVTFDLVPAVAGRGLDYAATVARPARGVTVELLQNGSAIASTTTDATGNYSFANVAANADVAVRVRAEMLRVGAPSWDFRVVDNVNGDGLYTLAGAVFNTGTVNVTRNLHAESGWTGAAYAGSRAAAPFAILDVAYDAAQLVLTAAPSTVFPALRFNWSSANVPVEGTAAGEIGSTRFRTDGGIFLVGAADQDTDEYDRHVIAHEFGHYLEHRFSRSDSFGGPHALTDQLDMRVAFGEGWGSAFAGMTTNDAVYVDTHGTRQASDFSVSLEQSPLRTNPNPGWFNEESLQSLLFDLYDNGKDVPRGTLTVDDLALGFAPIWSVFTNQQRSTNALTSVFSFVNAIRTARPADQSQIDNLTTSQRIAAIRDDYGTGQTNFGVPTQRTQAEVEADFHSIYDSLTVGSTLPNVCSLTDYADPRTTGGENKLASRRFVRFSVVNPGVHVITARARAPLNAPADPDLVLHLGGGQTIESSKESPSTCTVGTPAACSEQFTPTLQAGDYVLEVYEWSNTNATDDAYPPIGRTCFDVTVM